MNSVSNYIDNCLAYEQYAFSWDELKATVLKSETALKQELSRLSRKGKILTLRQNFYLIFTPRYKQYGKLPLELYVDKLFNYLEKPYYVAFFSAAALHGASHQQVQQSYLMTKIPNIRDIKKGNHYLNVSATSNWPETNIIIRKSDAGYFNVSSPALTAIDLIHYQTKMGGLNRSIAILEELSETITVDDVKKLLQWYPHISSIQRLGYLLQEIQADQKLITLLKDYLNTKKFFPILLSPEKGKKAGLVNNQWKVDVNIELESDL